MPLQYDAKDASNCWPAGDYNAELFKVEQKTSKTSGNPMEEWSFKVFNDDGRSQIISDYVTVPACTFKIKQLAIALNKKSDFEANVFQAEDYIGANVVVALKIEESDEYDDKNKIGKVKSPSTPTQPIRQASQPATYRPQGNSIAPAVAAHRPPSRGPSSPPFKEDDVQFADADIPFAHNLPSRWI